MFSSSVAKVARRNWESSWGKGEWSFKHAKWTRQCSKRDSVASTSSKKDSIGKRYRYFCIARWAADSASRTWTVAERCLRLWKGNCQSASQFSGQMPAVRGSAQGRGYTLKRYLYKRVSQTSANDSILLNLMWVIQITFSLYIVIYYIYIHPHVYLCIFIKACSVTNAGLCTLLNSDCRLCLN